MLNILKRFAYRLPIIKDIRKRRLELAQQQTELAQQQTELAQQQTELAQQQAELAQQQAELSQGQGDLNRTWAELAQGQTALNQRWAELAQGQTALNQRHVELAQRQVELGQKEFVLKSDILKYNALVKEFEKPKFTSIDHHPWRHPYLTEENLSRFRDYSEAVWQFALKYAQDCCAPLKIAFTVNMAQSMHKWACLAQKYGAEVGLFPVVWDHSAIGAPEWENFDGEWLDIADGVGFLKANPDIHLEVPCYRLPMEAYDFYEAYQAFLVGDRTPLLHFLAKVPGLRYEVMMSYKGYYHYYYWTEAVAKYDVIHGTSMPLNAYFSGRPYAVFSSGADLQDDCGRGDEYGQVMSLCFNAAQFLLFTNPHTLSHCRRLGFTNGLYLPYPMDDSRYCPGEGQARKRWEACYGEGVYVLMSCRIDNQVKGQDDKFFQTLVDLAKQRPQLRFVFLAWGNNAAEFRVWMQSAGLDYQFIMLNPVGKKRLIDYYRSCDIVLDQFVYGYHGATGLEAAAIGKPVIIKLRTEHYAPWYKGDYMPALNAATPEEIASALLTLADNSDLRLQTGLEMRRWLVRNHGEARTMPLLLALLRLTADRVPLPQDLVNPLWDEEAEAERDYHQTCLQPLFN